MTLSGRALAKHDLEERAGSELYELKQRLEEERSKEKESFQRYVQWLTLDSEEQHGLTLPPAHWQAGGRAREAAERFERGGRATEVPGGNRVSGGGPPASPDLCSDGIIVQTMVRPVQGTGEEGSGPKGGSGSRQAQAEAGGGEDAEGELPAVRPLAVRPWTRKRDVEEQPRLTMLRPTDRQVEELERLRQDEARGLEVRALGVGRAWNRDN
jgi:hypothetical protein